MRVYQLIRKIHLLSTLVLATFIFMYFATGFIMIFEETFQRKNVKVEKIKEKVEGIRYIDGDSLVRWSMAKYRLRGQYQIRENATSTVVDFRHPGTTASLTLPNSSDSVHVEIRKGNFNTTMHQYHRLHGYYGGVNYYVWAFMYDLSALSMIVFSITGFYLWYKTERKRLAGWLVLLASTLLTFSTIFYLMYR
jgi:hypothetical protein